MMNTKVSRIRGVLVGTAAGDALGAGYEFGPPLDAGKRVTMKGGGVFRWEPGEWTDDTSMALLVAGAAALGDLRTEHMQDYLVRGWVQWSGEAKDVGTQTRAVLRLARSASSARGVAEAFHNRTGRSGGNGSLMRTAPVALAFLNDPAALTEAATAVSTLTHFDPEAAEACVLWSHAIQRAVLTGQMNVREGLVELPRGERRDVWEERLYVAEHSEPRDFKHNGWVVEALQAAWCAIYRTADHEAYPPKTHLKDALVAAVRGGGDTDTVAAIAGGLLGAAYGEHVIPVMWRMKLHGWPGMDAQQLGDLAESAAS